MQNWHAVKVKELASEFFCVSADYLPGLTISKITPIQELAEMHWSVEMIKILKAKTNTRAQCPGYHPYGGRNENTISQAFIG